MTSNPLPKSLRLAPAPEQVFKRANYHAQYFLPILTLELSDIFEDLSGLLHFVEPIGPQDGMTGEFTKAYHTYYCRENWVSFKVSDESYEFEGEEEFFDKHFFKSHPIPMRVHESVRDGWAEGENAHYVKRIAEYNQWKENLTDDKSHHFLNERVWLGVKPFDANWAHCTDFPLVTDKVDVEGDRFPDLYHYPLTEDGRRFRYIGRVAAFDWHCEINLFYDPIEDRALQTFDWT